VGDDIQDDDANWHYPASWSTGRTRLGIVEVVYDDEAREGRHITAPDVPLPDDVRDKFDGERGGAFLRFFEDEAGSGRLSYVYPVGYNTSMTYRLGVLDFA